MTANEKLLHAQEAEERIEPAADTRERAGLQALHFGAALQRMYEER